MRVIVLIVSCLSLVLVACNKEKRYSKKLMKGEQWEVRNVTVDGNSLAFFGQWNITSDVDIYDSVPRLEWLYKSEDAICEWQFQDKGKSFFLNYYQLCEECYGTDMDSLDYVAYHLSGEYSVERHGKNRMEFESTTTNAFPGKTVVISIERK